MAGERSGRSLPANLDVPAVLLAVLGLGAGAALVAVGRPTLVVQAGSAGLLASGLWSSVAARRAGGHLGQVAGAAPLRVPVGALGLVVTSPAEAVQWGVVLALTAPLVLSEAVEYVPPGPDAGVRVDRRTAAKQALGWGLGGLALGAYTVVVDRVGVDPSLAAVAVGLLAGVVGTAATYLLRAEADGDGVGDAEGADDGDLSQAVVDLGDDDPTVRTEAAAELGRAADEDPRRVAEATSLLADRVEHDPDPEVRALAAGTLATVARAEPTLVAAESDALLAAVDDGSPAVREEAGRALAHVGAGDPGAVADAARKRAEQDGREE